MHRKVLNAAGLDFRDQPPIVATVRDGVELRSQCVWCNEWLQDITSGACSAPDGDGHLFRLAPYTSAKSGPAP